MALHHPTSKIYSHLMSPAAACAPQTTPRQPLLHPALFQKVTGLSRSVPSNSEFFKNSSKTPLLSEGFLEYICCFLHSYLSIHLYTFLYTLFLSGLLFVFFYSITPVMFWLLLPEGLHTSWGGCEEQQGTEPGSVEGGSAVGV